MTSIQAAGVSWGDIAWVGGGALALIFASWHASRGFAAVQAALALLGVKLDALTAVVSRLQVVTDGQIKIMADDRAASKEAVRGNSNRLDSIERRVAEIERRITP